jgi:hypothetical protein
MTDDQPRSAAEYGTTAAWLPGGNEPPSPAERSGEHRLILGILEDALALYARSLSASPVKPREAREARQWLESCDRSSPFAFESICDQLGLDPSYIRRGLRIVCARPAAAAARLAARHRGRPPGPTRPLRNLPGAPPSDPQHRMRPVVLGAKRP